MKLTRDDSVEFNREGYVSWNWYLRTFSNFAIACVILVVFLGQMVSVAASESVVAGKVNPVLGDRDYKLDLKYSPIYGSPRGKSFFLHYCLPEFLPRRLGQCELGKAPGSDPDVVQVHYKYSLGSREAESATLEGGGVFIFPFPVNMDLEGRTPYLEQYKKQLARARDNGRQVARYQGELKSKYEGLERYESPALPGGWWVPEDISEYQTRLGNPPIFLCSSYFCMLTLDQGNGWVVTAIFNEAALKDWRTFFVQLNESIKIIME